MLKLPYRYPGTKPFTKEQSHLFFGRKAEVEKLYGMLQQKKVVTLYADSGLGKSSLINAGLIPEFENRSKKDETFNLIRLRFGICNDENRRPVENEPLAFNESEHADTPRKTLLEILIAELKQQVETFENKSNPFIDESPEYILWYLVKLYERNGQRMLLIFDQAEEIFTYPDAELKELKKQLFTVIDSQIPAGYDLEISRHVSAYHVSNGSTTTAVLEEVDRDIEFMYRPINARILFVIRSDNLGMLKSFEDSFPDILKDTFNLLPLGEDGAKDAIIRPSKMKGEFRSPGFTYTDAAITKFLDTLRERNSLFDPFSVQLNCRYIERALVEQGTITINDTDIPEDAKAVNDFLDSVWGLLPFPDKEQLREFKKTLEKRLIDFERKKRIYTPDGPWLDKRYKTILVDEGLLKEESLNGLQYLELSHDRLVGPLIQDFNQIDEIDQKEIIKRQRKQLEKEASRIKKIEKLKDEANIAEWKAKDAEKKAKNAEIVALRLAEEAKKSQEQSVIAEELAKTAERLAKRHLTLAKWALVIIFAVGAVAFYNLIQVERGKNKLKKLLGSNLLMSAEKAYADDHVRLAFLLAYYSDTYSGNNAVEDLLKKWEVNEYPGRYVQIGAKGAFVGRTHSTKAYDSLEVVYLADTTMPQNPSISFSNIFGYVFSDDAALLAVQDSLQNIFVYQLDTLEKGKLKKKLLRTFAATQFHLDYEKVLTPDFLFASKFDTCYFFSLKGKNDQVITNTGDIYVGTTGYGYNNNIAFFRDSRNTLLSQLKLKGNESKLDSSVFDAVMEVSNVLRKEKYFRFLYNTRDGIIYKIYPDTIAPLISTGRTDMTYLQISERDDYYLFYYPDSLQSYVYHYAVIPRLKNNKVEPMQDLKKAGYLFNEPTNVAFGTDNIDFVFYKDSLAIVHDRNRIDKKKIDITDTLLAKQENPLSYAYLLYMPQVNEVYDISSYSEKLKGAITLGQQPTYILKEPIEIRQSPLRNSFYYSPGGYDKSVSRFVPYPKDSKYWKTFFGDLTKEEKKLYGIAD